MEIKILGSGCTKCKKVQEIVTEVIVEKDLNATIIKVEDIMEIMSYNVMQTPAIVVDEKVVLTGYIPNKKQVEEILESKK